MKICQIVALGVIHDPVHRSEWGTIVVAFICIWGYTTDIRGFLGTWILAFEHGGQIVKDMIDGFPRSHHWTSRHRSELMSQIGTLCANCKVSSGHNFHFKFSLILVIQMHTIYH